MVRCALEWRLGRDAGTGDLRRFGSRGTAAQVACMQCRVGGQAYGIWHLTSGQRAETVKVRGTLGTIDGEIAVNWALAGHGLIMRAEWDIAKYLASGRLRQVLENWQTPVPDIHAVYPQRLLSAARVRAFVDFVVNAFSASNPLGQVLPLQQIPP